VFRYYIPPVLDRVTPFCPTTISDPNFIPAICSDCLIQPGSTLEKPDFLLYLRACFGLKSTWS
ncbi:MAG: hypothetical protein KDC80_23630, partial [Saprospiraceae bacterium]|nr:hypothetical protein [Saprospiraceae bacterium]